MGNLVKVSPEHVREVSALEQLHIPQRINAIPGIEEEGEVRNRRQTETTPTDISEVQQTAIEAAPETQNIEPRPASSSEEQPDQEPIEEIESMSGEDMPNPSSSIAPAENPVPEDTDEGDIEEGRCSPDVQSPCLPCGGHCY